MACTDPNAIRAAELTGHRRFLELLDPDHPDYDPRYAPVVAAIAGVPESPPPVPSRSDLAQVSACPHRRKPDCGCGGWLCSLGKGDRRAGESRGVVTVYDCLTC